MPESTPLFLSLFLISTFIGSLTSGLTGFAAGLVVSGVWLQILTPRLYGHLDDAAFRKAILALLLVSGLSLLLTPLVMQQPS